MAHTLMLKFEDGTRRVRISELMYAEVYAAIASVEPPNRQATYGDDCRLLEETFHDFQCWARQQPHSKATPGVTVLQLVLHPGSADAAAKEGEAQVGTNAQVEQETTAQASMEAAEVAAAEEEFQAELIEILGNDSTVGEKCVSQGIRLRGESSETSCQLFVMLLCHFAFESLCTLEVEKEFHLRGELLEVLTDQNPELGGIKDLLPGKLLRDARVKITDHYSLEVSLVGLFPDRFLRLSALLGHWKKLNCHMIVLKSQSSTQGKTAQSIRLWKSCCFPEQSRDQDPCAATADRGRQARTSR